MNKYKGRSTTSKNGFIPKILDFDGDVVMAVVLDNSYVEYGTGCWVDKGSHEDVSSLVQGNVWLYFNEERPEGHFVFNTCSDYRVCYNPNCLATMPSPDFEE